MTNNYVIFWEPKHHSPSRRAPCPPSPMRMIFPPLCALMTTFLRRTSRISPRMPPRLKSFLFALLFVGPMVLALRAHADDNDSEEGFPTVHQVKIEGNK